MLLDKLSSEIRNFISKGNNKEDITIRMGIDFYSRFVEACESHSNIKVDRITHFLGIPISTTHYLKPDECALLNEKKLLDESPWKYKMKIF